MAENVLYYPYIKVPHSAWFTRVLLYWDSVGSIVPYDYINKPEELGSYMQALLTEGLVKQIFPGSYIYNIPRFEDAFLEYAEDYKRKLNRNSQVANPRTLRVHIEKLGNIGEKLCKMGVAKQAGYPWFDIEYQLANKFMAYLTGVLSSLPEIKSRPITDQQHQLCLYGGFSKNRNIILDNLLPAPEVDIPAYEMAQFKSKNQKYLSRFRNKIELFILQNAATADQKLRAEMTAQFVKKSNVEINGLLEAMKSQGWKKISFGRFLSYAAVGTTLADAFASGGLLTVIAAAFGVGAAGYSTFKESKLPEGLSNSFCAYAALANNFHTKRNFKL